MSSNPVSRNDDDYQGLMQRYADIQHAAYTSQSAKSDDIASLREEMSSYFESHTDIDQADSGKVLTDLDSMKDMAAAHEQDVTHTDNEEWDSVRSDMDSLIKELAPQGADTSIIDRIPRGGGSSDTQSGQSGAGGARGSSTGHGASTPLSVSGAGQGDGSGSGLNYNNPANSQTYKGLTLEQLSQGNSGLAQAIRKHPEIVQEIKEASARTGVPEGLMAATAYAETSFGENTTTTQDSGGQPSVGVFQGGKAEMDQYNPGGNLSNLHDNVTMFANFMADQYKHAGNSWGGALRYWNSGYWDAGTPLPNPHNLAVTRPGAGISNYVENILGKIAMGQSH